MLGIKVLIKHSAYYENANGRTRCFRRYGKLSELITQLGEGTFHQMHGGIATNQKSPAASWRVFNEEYTDISNKPFEKSGKNTYLSRETADSGLCVNKAFWRCIGFYLMWFRSQGRCYCPTN